MSGKPPGPIVLGVLALLAEHGPMTRAEVCQHLGRERDEVAAVMTRLGRRLPTVPRRIHVAGYVHEVDQGRRYPRAQYALGDRPDARKPKPDKAAVAARYRERNKGLVVSVFDLGRPGRGRRRLIRSGP